MKSNPILVAAVIFLVSGCKRMNEDARADLINMRHKLSSFVDTQKSNPSASTPDQFYQIYDFWNKIEDKHHYPKPLEFRINNGLHLYRFVMVQLECMASASSEGEQGNEKDRYLYSNHFCALCAKAGGKGI